MLMDVLPVLGTKGTEKRANKTNWRKEEKKNHFHMKLLTFERDKFVFRMEESIFFVSSSLER